jgi:hypothetical protein
MYFETQSESRARVSDTNDVLHRKQRLARKQRTRLNKASLARLNRSRRVIATPNAAAAALVMHATIWRAGFGWTRNEVLADLRHGNGV